MRISGPFLPQFIVGRFRQVRVWVPAFTAAGIEFDGLDATLTDVRTPVRAWSADRRPQHGSGLRLGHGLRLGRGPRLGPGPGPGRVVAGELTATASIPFAVLADRLPPGFTLRRHEHERHGQELRIHGWALAVPVTGTVEISADLSSISVNPRLAGIPSLVGFRIELPGLPPGVAITSIGLAETSITVSLAGRDVQFAGAGNVNRGAVNRVRRMRAG